MRSGTPNSFMGNTALISNLSCDSVMAGAFFPQPDSHMPEEKVSQHAGQHMVAPAGKLSHLVVIHPQVRFGFLEALLDGPAHPGKPDKGFKSDGSACVRDEVGIRGAFPKAPAYDQPDSSVGLSVFGQNDPLLHELIGDRPFRPLGHGTAIPEVLVRPPGDLLEGDRLLFGFCKNAFPPLLSAVPVGLLQGVLSPAKDEPSPHRNADPLIGF